MCSHPQVSVIEYIMCTHLERNGGRGGGRWRSELEEAVKKGPVGRAEEARGLIHKAAKKNKVVIDDSLIQAMERTIKEEIQEEETQKTYTAVDLFRYPNLRCKTLILLLCWLTVASLYYVLLLDQSELSDNKYIGFFITAGVQIPGYLYVIFTLERPMFGRKRSMCIFLIMTGLALTTHPFIPKEYPAIRITISVIGRFAANCSYTILNLSGKGIGVEGGMIVAGLVPAMGSLTKLS